jgi:hypothetical protein
MSGRCASLAEAPSLEPLAISIASRCFSARRLRERVRQHMKRTEPNMAQKAAERMPETMMPERSGAWDLMQRVRPWVSLVQMRPSLQPIDSVVVAWQFVEVAEPASFVKVAHEVVLIISVLRQVREVVAARAKAVNAGTVAMVTVPS